MAPEVLRMEGYGKEVDLWSTVWLFLCVFVCMIECVCALIGSDYVFDIESKIAIS